MVVREVHYKELQAQYVERATTLATWLLQTREKLSAPPQSSDTEQLHRSLDLYADFGRTERPSKFQELLDVEDSVADVVIVPVDDALAKSRVSAVVVLLRPAVNVSS